jgi:hypothetical protein
VLEFSRIFGESDMMRYVVLAVSLVSAGAALAQQNTTVTENPGTSAAPPPAVYPAYPPGSPLYVAPPPRPYIVLGSPQISACNRIPTSLTCSW